MRKQFKMNQFQYEELQARYKAACESRENIDAKVDAAWNDLGKAMGFYGDTARCMLGDPMTFTAIPMEVETNGL